ncbi:transposase [Erysipelothrix inopinata]|uniref:Transposase n=1 Tax=Erysipelothrix inopinata TaxID=225084 RepID=A0A7G9S1M6_9FIRM|nr:transposase [Erysipelothrix inopinata]QNN61751.1 transposase [Erysipelothrix inopinata]
MVGSNKYPEEVKEQVVKEYLNGIKRIKEIAEEMRKRIDLIHLLI